jgi:hypothetical protein
MKCILNDTNLNNSFKIHHIKKGKKHFRRGDSNRLPQQQLSAGAQQYKFTHKYVECFYWRPQICCVFLLAPTIKLSLCPAAQI